MGAMHLEKMTGLDQWDETIRRLPDAHVLQSREWSEIKTRVGWSPTAYRWLDEKNECRAACLILKRQIRLPGLKASILYAPKGPLLDWHDQQLAVNVLSDLKRIAKQENAIFLKIDPDVVLGKGLPGTDDAIELKPGKSIRESMNSLGWRYSDSQIQFRNSIHIDLHDENEVLLSRMKQKTRYNIRLAEKKGVTVKRGTMQDSDKLYQMYAETSLRNGFTIREKSYYEHVWKVLFDAGLLEFLIAHYENNPIAALILVHFGIRSYYFYGMSSESHRDLMPTYLLQWEAIKVSKVLGCQLYDLWGAPEEFKEGDPLWGVYRFKEGLGGEVVRTLGAWDLVIHPFLYFLYSSIMPRVLAMMRARGKTNTQQEVGP